MKQKIVLLFTLLGLVVSSQAFTGMNPQTNESQCPPCPLCPPCPELPSCCKRVDAR